MKKKASGHLAETEVGRSASAIVLPIFASLQRTSNTARSQRADLVCVSRARNLAVNPAGWDVQVGLTQRMARGAVPRI